jgi:hypothetical protein
MDRLAALRLIGIGFYIVFCIFGGVLAGSWLSQRLPGGIVYIIIGFVAGIALAYFGVYRMLLPALEIQRKKKKN